MEYELKYQCQECEGFGKLNINEAKRCSQFQFAPNVMVKNLSRSKERMTVSRIFAPIIQMRWLKN